MTVPGDEDQALDRRPKNDMGQAVADTVSASSDAMDAASRCDGCDGCDGLSGCNLLQVSSLLFLAALLVPDTGTTGGVLALLRAYRRWLTRFTPRCPSPVSCSAYALAAVAALGPRRGLVAAARRVRGCGDPEYAVRQRPAGRCSSAAEHPRPTLGRMAATDAR
jgi:hypothetical protein